jgi:hypothetical protein
MCAVPKKTATMAGNALVQFAQHLVAGHDLPSGKLGFAPSEGGKQFGATSRSRCVMVPSTVP